MKTEPAKLQTFLKTITVPITAPLKSEPVKTIITPPSNPKASSNISVHIGNITISANTKSDISSNVASELEREIRKVLEKINSDRERRKY
jgi:ribosome-associated translation inhibitor RaiA